MYVVYALMDPNGYPRYIGKTAQSEINERLRNHLKDKTKCRRVSWLKSLKGVVPKVEILAELANEKDALEEEKYLISLFRYLGADLTNQTDGGDGISGYRHTRETRDKMSKSRKGHFVSEETRRKLSESNRKRTRKRGQWHHTPESKAKLTGRRARKVVDEHGNMFKSVREVAILYGVDRTSIEYAIRKGRATYKIPRLRYASRADLPSDAFLE